ncbi:MAG: NAD-dependent epimerase/dehydratase family protein [Candidatus Binatia bacterium]
MKPEVIATPDANAGRREMASQVDGKPAVLVTGSTGLIGSKIIEAFAGDYRVIGLDVKRPQEQVAGAEWIECDVTRDESVVRSLAAVRERYSDRLASVIHLAAYYDFSGEPSPLYRTLTVEGTRRLLQALQQFKVEQFVFSSTLLVMKPAEEDEVITERSVTESEEETWDYPRSKIEAERVIRQERGAIPTVILRIAGVYDDNCRSIPIAQQISRIYEKRLESHFFPGDASHGQAFVHLNDLVDCFRKVVDLRRELEPHELFLVAEPDVMSYADLQDQIGELIHQQEWATIRVPKVIAKAGAWVQEKMAGEEETFIKPWMVDLADAHYPVEIERARQILGWEPQHLLRNTLTRMIGDLKTDPRQWYQKNKLKWQEDEQQKPAGKQ